MSREGKLAKNTAILSIGTLMPKVVTFVTLPVLTAYLTKEQYGSYDLITILVSLVLPVTTLLIQSACFRFMIGHQQDREYARRYFTNSIAFVVPVALISLFVLYFFLPIQDASIKLWVCVYLFFDAIVANTRQITRGMSRNLDYSISAIISAVIKIGLTFLLVQFLKWELKGAVIALAMSPIVSLLFLAVKIKLFELIDFRLVSKDTIKEMLAYSWPMVPNNLSAWVMRASDRFVILMAMGVVPVADYAAANKIPNLLTLAQSTFSMAWQENASIASSDQDAAKYYSKMFRTMTDFYAGSLGLIIACTPILFKLLIRGDYAASYQQMPILFLATFFHCMAAFFGGIYIAYKKTKSVGVTTMAAAVCNIVVDVLLIRWIGLYAASGSTLVSYMFLFFFRMKDVRKLVGIEYDIPRFMLALAIIGVECVLCFINTRALNIVNVCFGIAAFFLLNRNMIADIVTKLRRKLNK